VANQPSKHTSTASYATPQRDNGKRQTSLIEAMRYLRDNGVADSTTLATEIRRARPGLIRRLREAREWGWVDGEVTVGVTSTWWITDAGREALEEAG
jgi:hypothetical protein